MSEIAKPHACACPTVQPTSDLYVYVPRQGYEVSLLCDSCDGEVTGATLTRWEQVAA